MRQENHSMKAAYPFYLCLLSLKYSLTSESPPTPSCSAHLKRETSCSAHLKWGTYLIRLKREKAACSRTLLHLQSYPKSNFL